MSITRSKRCGAGSEWNGDGRRPQHLEQDEMLTFSREPFVFQNNLLDDLRSLSPDRKWWVIFTKPRQQQALASDMLAAEVPFYMPLAVKLARIRDREVSCVWPLFSNYLFLFSTEQECMQSLLTHRVNRILPVPEQEEFHDDLQQIHQLVESNRPLAVERNLVTGSSVRIRSGTLKGVEGTVVERRGSTRLLVAVRFLQSGVSVEIDETQIEPIEQIPERKVG
jgi:transcriptional antiterminator RfaH